MGGAGKEKKGFRSFGELGASADKQMTPGEKYKLVFILLPVSSCV